MKQPNSNYPSFVSKNSCWKAKKGIFFIGKILVHIARSVYISETSGSNYIYVHKAFSICSEKNCRLHKNSCWWDAIHFKKIYLMFNTMSIRSLQHPKKGGWGVDKNVNFIHPRRSRKASQASHLSLKHVTISIQALHMPPRKPATSFTIAKCTKTGGPIIIGREENAWYSR